MCFTGSSFSQLTKSQSIEGISMHRRRQADHPRNSSFLTHHLTSSFVPLSWVLLPLLLNNIDPVVTLTQKCSWVCRLNDAVVDIWVQPGRAQWNSGDRDVHVGWGKHGFDQVLAIRSFCVVELIHCARFRTSEIVNNVVVENHLIDNSSCWVMSIKFSDMLICRAPHVVLGCSHNCITALVPGAPGWAGARRELLDFMVQGKINRGRRPDHPARRHSIRTNQCPSPPSPLIRGCK